LPETLGLINEPISLIKFTGTSAGQENNPPTRRPKPRPGESSLSGGPFGGGFPKPGALPHAYAIQKVSPASPRAAEGATSRVIEAICVIDAIPVRRPPRPADCRRHEEALAGDVRLFARARPGLEPHPALTRRLRSGLPLRASQIKIADALLINAKIATGGSIPSMDHDLILNQAAASALAKLSCTEGGDARSAAMA
jgi:hypothetical protein